MKRVVWGLAAALAVAVPASGQETLTLDQVLQRASEYNPAYRRALNNLELSSVEHRAAIGAFLPSINLSAGTGLSANRRLTSTDNFGNPIENPFTEWRTSSSSSQSVSVSLDLFRGLTRFKDIQRNNAQARARARAAEAALAGVTATLRRETLRSLRQRALLVIEEEARAGRETDLANTRQLFNIADASTVDVRAAELEVIRQDRQIADARVTYEQALLALRAAIGDPGLRDFELDAEAPEPFDPALIDVDELVEAALERNPTLLENVANVDASRASLSAARGGRWPTLGLSLSGTQNTYGLDTDGFFNPYPNDSRYASLSLSLSIPVFRQFETSRQIASADIDLRNARQVLRESELQIDRDVRTRFLDLERAWENYSINVRTQELAEERLVLAREEYQMAGMSFVDLQQAINDALTERRTLINAQFDFLDALVNLEESVGSPVVTGQGG